MIFGFGIVGGAGALIGLEAQRTKSQDQIRYEQAAMRQQGLSNAHRLMDAVYCAPRGPSEPRLPDCEGCSAPAVRYAHHCAYCKRPR